MESRNKPKKNFPLPKKTSPDLLNKIMNALLTLEQRWDKPGFSVRKIARELCHDYVDDHNLELRIRIELERMAEMGVVVRNSHTKDVWKSSDNLQIVKSTCKKFIEKHCRDGETRDDDGGDVQFVECERSRDGQQYRDREQPGGNNQYHDGEQLMDQDLQIVEEHVFHRGRPTKRNKWNDDDADVFVGNVPSIRKKARKSILKKPTETRTPNKRARKDLPIVIDLTGDTSDSDCESVKGWPKCNTTNNGEGYSDRLMPSQPAAAVTRVKVEEDNRPTSSHHQENDDEDDHLDSSCIIM